MNKKLILTITIILGIFTTALVAADFEAATKPSLILSQEDLNLIDGAIASNFKNLSTKDKIKLKSFLKDYAASVKREKNATSASGKKAPSPKGKKGIKKYKAGSISK